MSQQEPSDPSLIKWSSKAELDLHTFIIYTSTVLLSNKTTQEPGWTFQHRISSQLFRISSAGATHGLGNVTVSGTGILMRSSPLLSVWVISAVQLSQPILEQPHHRRDAAAALLPSPSVSPSLFAHVEYGTDKGPALRIGRGWTAWPQILSCKNLKKERKRKKPTQKNPQEVLAVQEAVCDSINT